MYQKVVLNYYLTIKNILIYHDKTDIEVKWTGIPTLGRASTKLLMKLETKLTQLTKTETKIKVIWILKNNAFKIIPGSTILQSHGGFSTYMVSVK